MIFDIDKIGDDYGQYLPMDDTITIYLGTIWHSLLKDNIVREELLIEVILDTMIHEDIHKGLDIAIEGKPEDVDDHKVFKYLRMW